MVKLIGSILFYLLFQVLLNYSYLQEYKNLIIPIAHDTRNAKTFVSENYKYLLSYENQKIIIWDFKKAKILSEFQLNIHKVLKIEILEKQDLAIISDVISDSSGMKIYYYCFDFKSGNLNLITQINNFQKLIASDESDLCFLGNNEYTSIYNFKSQKFIVKIPISIWDFNRSFYQNGKKRINRYEKINISEDEYFTINLENTQNSIIYRFTKKENKLEEFQFNFHIQQVVLNEQNYAVVLAKKKFEKNQEIELKILNLENSVQELTIITHKYTINDIKWGTNENEFYSCGGDNKIIKWDVQGNKIVEFGFKNGIKSPILNINSDVLNKLIIFNTKDLHTGIIDDKTNSLMSMQLKDLKENHIQNICSAEDSESGIESWMVNDTLKEFDLDGEEIDVDFDKIDKKGNLIFLDCKDSSQILLDKNFELHFKKEKFREKVNYLKPKKRNIFVYHDSLFYYLKSKNKIIYQSKKKQSKIIPR